MRMNVEDSLRGCQEIDDSKQGRYDSCESYLPLKIFDPVYTLKKVMEELDFSGLLANCSDKGRTGYNPIMMYAVVT